MSGDPFAGYDNWLLRGSGAFSTEHDVTLPEPCACGSTEGILHSNDFGSLTLVCAECETEHDASPFEQPDDLPEPPDYWDHDPRDVD